MKRILTTIAALLIVVAGAFAQDQDPLKALAKVDPIFDVPFLRGLGLSDSQAKKLEPRINEIIKLIQVSLKEAEERIAMIDDELEKGYQANKAQSELGETIAALADKAVDQIFDAKQEIFYSAKVLSAEFGSKSVAAFVQARIARRMRFSKSQTQSMDRAITTMRREFERVAVDPEASDIQRQQIVQTHQQIMVKALGACANVMDKRQQTIVATFLEMLNNKKSGAQQ